MHRPKVAGVAGRHDSTSVHKATNAVTTCRSQFYCIFLFPWQDGYQHENADVFPGKMCSDRRKNHGCGQKKPKGTSSAIFGVGIPAKCCARTQALCRSSSQQTYWTTKPPKRQLSILLNFFFPLMKLFLTFVGSPCDVAPKLRDTEQVYLKCMSPHIGDPVVRT